MQGTGSGGSAAYCWCFWLRHWRGGLSRAVSFPAHAGLTLFLYICLHLLLFAQVYVGWSGELLLEELRSALRHGRVCCMVRVDAAGGHLDRQGKAMAGSALAAGAQVDYPAAILAWLHVLWLARSDVGEALIYGALFAVLLDGACGDMSLPRDSPSLSKRAQSASVNSGQSHIKQREV